MVTELLLISFVTQIAEKKNLRKKAISIVLIWS